ncbi:potassium-transporting ATPase subunit KdpA [Enterococcus avium]|uniref:Potassium-transporting ATPase potassium-binding subunit n=1 Tax=Enterococcus avium TaxID=33945 RepID=A0ABD5F8C4_ENTAV|nr:potassium-transporting ATPase subunit KdpA [Enterococcus avium]MDT2435947.1 potassium-transporting ATPase subunit KdpA [Enterococcus avium]MDT2465917.1 potassium-transporting ATPase subunit KdpA [Enterococcus avium]MDT2482982.1 potassium-transporting ATPase subunit KdpA [Enterococcus avium]MDT2505297.1 potassium-transporting ATPase subunit KdpA [Enterococcus avium]MDT2511309.1 potassium-transporting ATPase subunit KdpA [Enterococcus avium]
MLQIILILAIFIALIIPTGKYLYHIAVCQHTFADPVFNRVDNAVYRVCGIDKKEMNWKQYAIAMLATNAIMVFIGYLILRVQSLPILNPNGIGGMEPSLSFNTIISFMTNTNLQHYSGESGLSYFSQMMVIIFMMFTSAATGFSVAIAFVRGLAGKAKTVGNFYVDLIRIITRVLLPLSLLVGLILVSQGTPQNLSANITIQTIEGKFQDIAMGPIAALESIKHLGTNGGGFLGANSSTPFENPNAITNMVEMLSMMLLPGSCVIAFGHMVRNRIKKSKKGIDKKVLIGSEAKPIFAVMSIIFLIGLVICFAAESAGNPILEKTGLSQSMGNMEGKEVRLGIAQSSLFTTVTTCFTTGSVDNMHDTLTPLGGAVPLMNMMLNVVFGGKGVGLMNMILYAILAVFICGLMIGRTPEYLGKKIEGKEMKLTALGIIIHPLLILAFSALAVAVPAGLAGISNPGHHGLTQVLYEYASSAANNGSGFEGLGDNTYFWNITTGLVMFFGRYLSIIIQLAIAGSLLAKQPVSESIGTLKTDTRTFTISLLMVVIIIAALTFFPAVVLGPVAEHLTLWN